MIFTTNYSQKSKRKTDDIRLEKPELNLPNEYKMEYIFTLEDESTIVCFKEVIK